MNIVCIGAHPDDCEVSAGGTCVKWARQGHRVLLVSTTNGDKGHHAMSGGALVRRRLREAQLSAERGGVSSLVMPNPDGELTLTLETRKQVVRVIREAEAQIVLTHRPWDYHPDHRYTALLVQDAAFMVTVPNFCPETPCLERNPVFLSLMDSFTRPAPFQPDVAVDVDDAMETKLAMLDAMESQVYEWLPWLDGTLDTVPADPRERKEWLLQNRDPFFRHPAVQGREALRRWYGAERGDQVKYAELFEVSEYGHRPSEEELADLFPFANMTPDDS